MINLRLSAWLRRAIHPPPIELIATRIQGAGYGFLEAGQECSEIPMSAASLFRARGRWEPLSGSAASQAKTAFFWPLRRVAKQLLHAFVRWQMRRLDRYLATQELDDRFLR